MKNKKLTYDYEFHPLIVAEDGAGMERAVLGFLTEILNFWLEEVHIAFENFLRIFKQKYTRAMRAIGALSPRENCIFYLGVLFASQRIFESLYAAECQQRQLVSTFARQSPRSEEILLCLYQRNRGSGMRHGELAEALGLSDSALTNAMKRVLQSGAAEASRYGKNTFYTLSKAGQRYCAERTREPSRTQAQIDSSLLRQMLKVLPDKSNTLALHAGDLTQVTMDGKQLGRCRVQEIIQVFDTKSVNFEEVPETEPQEAQIAPIFFVNAWLSKMDWQNAALM